MRTSTTTLSTTALLCSLASALPTTNLLPRAGGPSVTPIPPSCKITHPTSNTPSYLPAPDTVPSALYSAYYPSFSTNTTQMADQCLQQCYGYGNHVECKTAFWAENVVVPEGYYGSKGGQLATACLMFDRVLGKEDFVGAPEGQGTDAFAASIEC